MRILYVDDDPDDREMFSDAMKTIDPKIECIVCAEVPVALQALKSGDFDFIFIDCRLPKQGGRTMLETIRANPKFDKTRIIMYSAYMTDVEKAECRDLGAYDCIGKPDDFQKLRSALEAVIRRAR